MGLRGSLLNAFFIRAMELKLPDPSGVYFLGSVTRLFLHSVKGKCVILRYLKSQTILLPKLHIPWVTMMTLHFVKQIM